MQLLGIWVLQQVLHGDRDEGEDLSVQGDYHTVQELTHTRVQQLSLHWHIEGSQKDAQGVSVHLHTVALLHCHLAGKPFASAAEIRKQLLINKCAIML